MLNNEFKRFIPQKPAPDPKMVERIKQQLERDIEQYLRSGGKITQIPKGESGVS